MKFNGISREAMLEIGLMSFLLSLIGGIVILFGGRIFGNVNREKNTPPPDIGVVGSDRHRNIANNSAR